jgi:hypothetical protein
MTAEQLIATAYAQSTDIHLMAGQSNMQGRAVDGTTLSSRANDGTIFEYRSGTTGRQTYLTNYPSGGPLTQFGPNVGMARTLNDGSHVIRYGAGGQSIAAFIPEARRLTSAPSIPAANSDHSTLIVDSFNAAISDLLLRHFKKPLNVDFIWYNGAEDAKTDKFSSKHGPHIPILVQWIAENVVSFTASSPIVVIRSPDWNANTPDFKPFQSEVRAGQESYVTATSNATLLTSDINQSVTTTWEDSSHIDAASQERLGIDLAAIV